MPVVSARIDAGDCVLNEPLALLIAQTRSSDLYEKVRDRLFPHDGALLTLYKGRYPDPEIEKELCKRLYSFAAKDGEPRRRYVLEAMHNVGSTALLPTLEALLFDLGPSVKVREAFGDSLGIVGALEAKSRIEFVRLVSLAIEDIKDRARTAPETTEPPGFQDDKVSEQVDQISRVARAKEQVKDFIDTKQPEAAIIYIRIGAEALAKDLYRRSGFEKNAKPARKMMLDELLQSIKGSNAPDMLKHLLQTFQLFGNFGLFAV